MSDAATVKSRIPLVSAANRQRWLLAPVLLLCALPSFAVDRHEGVASCAGSTCHAATRPLGKRGIRQDEYFIWQQHDAHARATSTLATARSRQMGAVLGIEPTSATQCLACHAENIAPAERGERWLASDGIGCETCHGGSERWLASHTQPGLSLDEKTALGMTPTWQPQARAALCLGCHQGDAAHPITHAMMAAGHPALLFELDTFTALQPPHHDRDADYLARKGAQDPARDWVTGQAVAAEQLLQHIESGQLGHGLFPELAYFDCDACHHPMSAGRWLPGRNAGTAAGSPALADASLYWLGLWLQARAPETATVWQQRSAELQAATQSGLPQLTAAARRARASLQQQVLPLLSERPLTTAELKTLLRAIAGTAQSPRAHDFLAAEQAAMAAVVIGDALAQRGVSLSTAQRRAVDALFAAVRQRETFKPRDYHAALMRLRDSIR